MTMRQKLILALAALSCAGTVAAREPRVTIEQRFERPADTIWQALGRFCGIASWQSLVASCLTEERADGFYRVVVMKDNSAFTERLESYSHEERFFRYSITAGPLPIDNYVSEFRIVPDGKERARLVWRAWYDTPPGVDAEKFSQQLEALFRNGIRGMQPLVDASR